MKSTMRTVLPALLALMLPGFCYSNLAQASFLPGEPAHETATHAAPATHQLPLLDEHSRAVIRLRPLSRTLTQRLNDGLLRDAQIGLNRDPQLDAEGSWKIHWTTLPDGRQIGRVTIVSPGASALRAGLRLTSSSGDALVRVSGESGRVLTMWLRSDRDAEPASAAASNSASISWTPVTEGSRQHIEVELAAPTLPDARTVRVTGISHLAVHPLGRFDAAHALETSARQVPGTPKNAGTPGKAAACHEDVACVPGQTEAYRNAVRSVVRLIFTRLGSSNSCSATLINDADATTQIPYLLTAAHCISTQGVASTVNTFWFLEAGACRSGIATAPVQLTEGATLLYVNTETDVALLRLNEPAPAGSYFAGWDARPVSEGMTVIALHHPAGDLKKLAIGQVMNAADSGVVDDKFIAVGWLSGATEAGSSGAALFTLGESEYRVRGVLRGGTSLCLTSGILSNRSNRDYFSRLDHDQDVLRQRLLAGPAPMYDYSDIWVSTTEPGWGVSIVQRPANQVMAVWFTRDDDGDPNWVTLTDAVWHSAKELHANLYQSRAKAGDGSGDSARVVSQLIGRAILKFSSRDHATFSYALNGGMITKPIARLKF